MDKVVAPKLNMPPDRSGLPVNSEWTRVPDLTFCSDWRGQNPDPARGTGVQLLWSVDYLFIRFECRYRGLFFYDDANRRRDRLWLRDVAEVFINPGTDDPHHYLEFEISPNGDWLDLDIFPGGKTVLYGDLKSRVVVDPAHRIWTAEMAIPMNCLTASFDPGRAWRVNFFRIEGEEPDRFYSAWRPTSTPQPNFHVPEAFGTLEFGD